MTSKLTADDVTILETREVPPAHFLLKIESFSLLGKNGMHKYESGEFNAGGYKWRLILYPNEDDMCVHLANIPDTTNSSSAANWEINVVFSIFLLNQISGNYHYSSGRTRRFQAMKLEWGITKFISREILMDPSNGFVIDDNCVFGAEVFVVDKLAVCECVSVKNVTDPYKRDWKISNFSELGSCWTSNEFDVEGLKWKVELHPKGQDHEKGRSKNIGIFLRLVDSKRVKAYFSVCIKDQINNKHKKKTSASRWFSSATSKSWGYREFMEISTLEDPRNGFITKDTFHLELEISVQAVV